MIKWCLTIGSLFLLTAGNCLADNPLAHYRYSRDIDGSFSEQEMVAIEIDATIWQAIGTDEVNIRITDREGNATPHLKRKAGRRETREVRHHRASNIESLSDQNDNQLELRVVLQTQANGANVIDFETPLEDFEKAVTIWGLENDDTEVLLAERARIYDYSRFADVRQTAIRLPEDSTQYRSFRILIEDVVDEEALPLRWETQRWEEDEQTLREEHRRILTRPFRMNAVNLYERREEDAGYVPSMARQTFDSVSRHQQRDPAGTVLEVEHTGAPLTSLKLDARDANFSRRITVETPTRRDGREVWQERAARQISRISFRDTQHESLDISLPDTRSTRYRITLIDQDNPPLQEVFVSPKGYIWQAVFLAEPDREYTIYYGADATSRPPQYDLSPLERLLRQDHEPVLLSLQEEASNPNFRRAGIFANENAMRILFALAIIVMLAVLGSALYRAARHIS